VVGRDGTLGAVQRTVGRAQEGLDRATVGGIHRDPGATADRVAVDVLAGRGVGEALHERHGAGVVSLGQEQRELVTTDPQERLRRLARLHNTGPVESLITQLVRDSRGTSVALTPGIEYALSASADAAAAAGEGARAWQARQAAWVNGGPCDDDLPHADAPDRLAQAVANLRDVGLWPWVEGSALDDTPYDQVLAPVRALLRDPTVAPVAIGQAAVRALYPVLLRAGGRASGLYGRAVVLIDLRPAAEATVSYIPGALLAASDTLLPPYIAVGVMIDAYDPEQAVLVVVHTTPLFMVYRLDLTPGAPPPDAPLIDFDQ